MSNYVIAKQLADDIDNEIIGLVSSKCNLKVEAGAGAGKTYSLHKVIDWLTLNKKVEFKLTKKKIACITYTNAAVEVIKKRIGDVKEIVPATIHSFAWENIKQYQSTLKTIIKDIINISNDEILKINSINYSLGVRYIEENILYLHHNDVINIFCKFLDFPKFRFMLEQKYLAILIDEYQDSYKEIMDRFINYFVEPKSSIQFCLFGDSWQTIYQSNNACGEVVNDKLKVVGKKVNFRSAKKIVEVLNKLRPELPQISAMDHFDGQISIVDCNDYSGQRRDDRNFKYDLPIEELSKRLSSIENKFTYQGETLKTLMLTHRVLASHQGYENLLRILGDKLKDMTDNLFDFVVNVVENVYISLHLKDVKLLYETLKNRPPIHSVSEKKRWRKLYEELKQNREKTIFDVLSIVINCRLIPVPPEIIQLYKDMEEEVDKDYGNGNILDMKEVKYNEFVAAREYVMPTSIYSTDHGVKGEEYDNIIFVISKGWNNYQFDKYLPMSEEEKVSNLQSYIRNRNLFYVACSRAKKRLCLFITYPVSDKFKNYLKSLFGSENYFTYDNFINKPDTF